MRRLMRSQNKQITCKSPMQEGIFGGYLGFCRLYARVLTVGDDRLFNEYRYTDTPRPNFLRVNSEPVYQYSDPGMSRIWENFGQEAVDESFSQMSGFLVPIKKWLDCRVHRLTSALRRCQKKNRFFLFPHRCIDNA